MFAGGYVCTDVDRYRMSHLMSGNGYVFAVFTFRFIEEKDKGSTLDCARTHTHTYIHLTWNTPRQWYAERNGPAMLVIVSDIYYFKYAHLDSS